MSKGIYERKPFTQKHLNNMSKARIGKKLKSFTQSHKDNISKSKTRENNPMYGRTGKNNPCWKGGEYQDKTGRWFIWINDIRYRRARYIAAQCLKRELTKGEVVHHINEDPSDDRPENLYVFSSRAEHSRQHHWKNPPILISNLLAVH